VQFVNFYNTNTTCVIVNNTFTNIDRTAIAVMGPINITITDNYCGNNTGRSAGNVAGIYVQGNPYFSTKYGVSQINVPGAVNGTYPNALVTIDRNYMDQNKTVLAPYDNRKENLVRVVHIWLRQVSNATVCFRNNSVRGMPIGVRFSDFNQSMLATCLTYPNNVFFPDIQRYLRAIANEYQCTPVNATLNETLPLGLYGVNGTYHDFEESFTDAHMELYGNVVYCDACCPPVPPLVCYVEPPGADPLYYTSHPWWGKYIFVSIVTCINHCNATIRECYVLGNQSDPTGSFILNGQPIPFKYYTEAIDTTVGPPINANQSNSLIIAGEPGLNICASLPHRLDNPLGIIITVEGLNFTHCDGAAPDWDYTDLSYESQNTTLNGNIFYGAQRTALVIDGTFDSNFGFIGNYMMNYTGGHGARFTGRVCTNHITVNLNTFLSFHGNNLEIYGFDYVVAGSGLPGGNGNYNNKFLDAGGVNSLVTTTTRFVVTVQTCADSLPGSITMAGNQVIGNPNVVFSLPLWTAYFVSPMPWNLVDFYMNVNPATDTKVFNFQSNVADGTLPLGLRMDDTTWNCLAADRQGFLREDIYYRFALTDLMGQEPPNGFWLYIGPFNAATEGTILAAPLVQPDNICRHCEAGCPRSSWDLLGWIAGGALLGIITVGCLCWLACPRMCFCCPQAPKTWHDDGELGQMVPDDRSMWLTMARWAPTWNQGRPWKVDEPPPREGLSQRPIRSIDEANIHQPFANWSGAIREDDQTRRHLM
jgi:hypothetical protein